MLTTHSATFFKTHRVLSGIDNGNLRRVWGSVWDGQTPSTEAMFVM